MTPRPASKGEPEFYDRWDFYVVWKKTHGELRAKNRRFVALDSLPPNIRKMIKEIK